MSVHNIFWVLEHDQISPAVSIIVQDIITLIPTDVSSITADAVLHIHDGFQKKIKLSNSATLHKNEHKH